MRRLRDVFYVNANADESYYEYYGMEFSEFLRYCPLPIPQILLLDPRVYDNEPLNLAMSMTTLDEQAIASLARQGAYELGNFHWMDYASEEGLARCTEQEKAEILYLNHYCNPLHTAFFTSVGNRFVYLAHDDGWYCRLYCKDMAVFGDIIANKIIGHFATNKRRKMYPIGSEIKSQLLEWAKGGLLIDFSVTHTRRNHCGISFYEIGNFSQMDDMYHNLDQKMHFATRNGWLEQTNKVWKMGSWAASEM